MQEIQEKSTPVVDPIQGIATVAAVINDRQVVINKGAQDGIAFGQRFTLYELSEQDIVDPTTNKSLGRLETIKGTGRVVHIQDKLSILEATHQYQLIGLIGKLPEVFFKGPKVGDKARPI
jgi:hypothetical protein